MNMPGFSAQAALARTTGSYRQVGARASAGEVVASATATAGGRSFGVPPLRCCKFDPSSGRVRCITRRWSPLENCVCTQTAAGPLFDCQPLVLTADL